MNSKTIKVNKKKVLCTGYYINQLGHPKVYLRIDNLTNKVICPYCNLTYIYESYHKRNLCPN